MMIEILLVFGLGYVLWKNRILIHNQWSKSYTVFLKKIQNQHKNKIETLLQRLGQTSINHSAWTRYQLNQVVVMVVLALLLYLLTSNSIWFFILSGLFLFQAHILFRKINTRKNAILKKIPFVLNMLILNLESGLDFLTSIEELVQMDAKHPLHQELKRTLQSIQLGETRSEAFSNMALRTNLPELQSLSIVIQQSETMGSSLIELLRLQSTELQHRIFKQAEAKAQKAPLMILIPMMIFIFPVVFILLFAPIALQLMGTFQ